MHSMNHLSMPQISFNYGWDNRPRAEVYIYGHNRRWLKIVALPDSGNDITLVTRDVGRQLGLDPRNGRQFQVVGISPNPMVFYKYDLPLKIGNFEPLITTIGVGDIGQNLLGREDIFQKFDIIFTSAGNTIFTCNGCASGELRRHSRTMF